jgi:hypothetical protein
MHMSQLFAFNNAEDMRVTSMPAGHYDAAQQLWIADDASYADMTDPNGERTKLITFGAMDTSGDLDFPIDIKLD